MLKKLLITLKYGEQKAKILILAIIVLVAGGLGLLVYGITGKSIIPLGAGALLTIIGLLLLFSFSFVNIDVDMEKKAQKKRNKSNDKTKTNTKTNADDSSKTGKNDSSHDINARVDTEIDFSMFADDLSDIAIGIGGIPGSGNTETKKEPAGQGSSEKNEENEGDLSDILSSVEDEYEDMSDSYKEDTGKSGAEKQVKNEKNDYEVKKPSPKQIKARKKMLKVRKDDRRFTPIIVDVWKDVSALRVPAFVQDKGKNAYIILVEGALRTEIMPMSEFLQVTYQKNVEEIYMEQYEEIRKDPELNGIFGELLPAFYQSSGRNNSEKMCKNLYVLGGKIAITPRSLRKLFNKFDFVFKVFDSFEIRGSYSDYFKAAYESRIFWTDNVITQNDYQERIRGILQNMIEDTELTNYDFERDIQLMVRYKLITSEYADYYKARKNDRIKIRI